MRSSEMSEIRKHYFLSKYCIIAEERAKRPSDFAGADGEPGKMALKTAFSAGEPRKILPLPLQYIKMGKSIPILLKKEYATGISAAFRIFILPFPLPRTPPEQPENGLQAEPGYGFHEVIVESPLHGRRLEDFSDSEISGLMKVYRDRTCSYTTREKIRYVSLFKNSGKKAGASISHLHSQLLALPFYPPLLERELKLIREKENCPYCAIFDTEKESPRLVFENTEWIAFTPYSSMGPFEVWILPAKHVSYLGTCSDKLLFALGAILKDVLKNYGRILGNLPFNYMFYQLSETPEYHLNLRLLPRLSINAGFELSTGIYINTFSPERAASYLRGDHTRGE